MTDIMLYGVLQMPYDMAMSDELSRHQYYSRAQQALEQIEQLREQLAVADEGRNYANSLLAEKAQQLAACQKERDELQSLRLDLQMAAQKLAACQKDGKHYAHEMLIAKDALAAEKEKVKLLRDCLKRIAANKRISVSLPSDPPIDQRAYWALEALAATEEK